jgi:predicted hydrocarbon binding protein
MSDPQPGTDGLILPDAALRHLHGALREEMDVQTANRVLREAGSRIGESMLDLLSNRTPSKVSESDCEQFWTNLDRFLQERGWGSTSQGRIHPGLGMIRAEGWAESDPEAGEQGVGCMFSVGMLSRILSAIGGAPIGVLEISCRSRGDADCAFAFGSEEATRRLEDLLTSGEGVEEALARL